MSSDKKSIGVFIVEDSLVSRELLKHIIESDPLLTVIGAASTGEEAVGFVEKKKPDVVIMDLHLPGIDGHETTRRIMDTTPVPVIVVSASMTPTNVSGSFNALDSGAVAVLQKPKGIGHNDFEYESAKLLKTIKDMAKLQVGFRDPGKW